MRGTIESFDDSVIIVENNNQKNMIYKHAISTITLNEETKEEINLLKKEVEKEISDIETSTNERIQDFQKVVNTRFSDMNKKIEDFITSENLKFENFTGEVNEKIHILRNEFFDLLQSLDKIYEYINKQDEVYWNKLKDYCDEIYTKRNIYYVKNPITGKIGEINSVLDIIYKITNHAVTCDEFKYIGLTAQEHANLNYTCIEYMKKYKDLYWRKYYTEKTSMQNPYTGKFENVVNVVKQLVKFHEENNSLTADEYVALNLTANEYYLLLAKENSFNPYLFPVNSEYYLEPSFEKKYLEEKNKGTFHKTKRTKYNDGYDHLMETVRENEMKITNKFVKTNNK